MIQPGPVFDQAPHRVYWEVTRACDLACRHCRAEARPCPDRAELGPEEARKLLDALTRFGSRPHLILTGGDPLTRPDLYRLIEAARGLGFPVAVAPSATPLLTPATIRRLKAAGVGAISLSLDGSDAARHDGLRGVPGCFLRTIAAAEECVAAGLPFQVNTLVSEETVEDLPSILRLVSGLGALRWSLFFLVAVGRGTTLRPIGPEACERLLEHLLDTRQAPQLVIATTEAPHARRLMLERERRRQGGARSAHAGGHAAGFRDGNGVMFISDTGEVHPSGFLPLSAGNVRASEPVTLYRESGLFRALRQPDRFGGRCGRCEYRQVCGGSRARAWAATGDYLAEDPLCAYEPRGTPPAEWAGMAAPAPVG